MQTSKLSSLKLSIMKPKDDEVVKFTTTTGGEFEGTVQKDSNGNTQPKHGTYKLKTGEVHVGDFGLDGKLRKGKITMADGKTTLEGDFIALSSGKVRLVSGKTVFPSGNISEGTYNRRTGNLSSGVHQIHGSTYNGEFTSSRTTGALVLLKGTYMSHAPGNELTFTGVFDKDSGAWKHGKCTFPNGTFWDGRFEFHANKRSAKRNTLVKGCWSAVVSPNDACPMHLFYAGSRSSDGKLLCGTRWTLRSLTPQQTSTDAAAGSTEERNEKPKEGQLTITHFLHGDAKAEEYFSVYYASVKERCEATVDPKKNEAAEPADPSKKNSVMICDGSMSNHCAQDGYLTVLKSDGLTVTFCDGIGFGRHKPEDRQKESVTVTARVQLAQNEKRAEEEEKEDGSENAKEEEYKRWETNWSKATTRGIFASSEWAEFCKNVFSSTRPFLLHRWVLKLDAEEGEGGEASSPTSGARHVLSEADQIHLERALLRGDTNCTLPHQEVGAEPLTVVFQLGGLGTVLIREWGVVFERQPQGVLQTLQQTRNEGEANEAKEEAQKDGAAALIATSSDSILFQNSTTYPLVAFSYSLTSMEGIRCGDVDGEHTEHYNFAETQKLERSMLTSLHCGWGVFERPPLSLSQLVLPEEAFSKSNAVVESNPIEYRLTVPISAVLRRSVQNDDEESEDQSDEVFLYALPRQVRRRTTVWESINGEGVEDEERRTACRKTEEVFLLRRNSLTCEQVLELKHYAADFFRLNRSRLVLGDPSDDIHIPAGIVAEHSLEKLRKRIQHLAHYHSAVAFFSDRDDNTTIRLGDTDVASSSSASTVEIKFPSSGPSDLQVRVAATSHVNLYRCCYDVMRMVTRHQSRVEVPVEWENDDEDEFDADENDAFAGDGDESTSDSADTRSLATFVAKAQSHGTQKSQQQQGTSAAKHNDDDNTASSSPTTTAPTPKYTLYNVPEGSPEYSATSLCFLSSGFRPVIVSIQRVQNRELYEKYVLRKRQAAKEHHGDASEVKWMMHGTRSTDPLVVCDVGFDHRYAEKGFYGRAAYFAYAMAYSHTYRHDTGTATAAASPSSSSSSGGAGEIKKRGQVVMAIVCRGRVDKRPKEDRTIIHPAVGCHCVEGPVTANHLAVMIYDLYQAYPAYLVEYEYTEKPKKK